MGTKLNGRITEGRGRGELIIRRPAGATKIEDQEFEVAAVFLNSNSATASRIHYALLPDSFVQSLDAADWTPLHAPRPNARIRTALSHRPLTSEDYSFIANLGVVNLIPVGCLVTSEMIEDLAAAGVARIYLTGCDIHSKNEICREITTLSIKGCWFSHPLKFENVGQIRSILPTEFVVSSQAQVSTLFINGRKEVHKDIESLRKIIDSVDANTVYLSGFHLTKEDLLRFLSSKFRKVGFHECFIRRMGSIGPVTSNLKEIDLNGLQGLSFANLTQICRGAKGLTDVSIGKFLLNESRLRELYNFKTIFFDCTSAIRPLDLRNPRGSVYRNVLF